MIRLQRLLTASALISFCIPAPLAWSQKQDEAKVGSSSMAAEELYVSPEGRPDAAGTRAAPTTLLAATKRSLEPGSTVYMLSGTYVIEREAIPVIAWQGTEDARITLCSAPGEWAAVDGGLIVRGAEYVTLRDFEVFRTRGGAYRYQHQWGEPVPEIRCGLGGQNHRYKINGQLVIAYQSRGLQLINLYLHDNIAGGGIGAWNPSEDMLVYGCLLIRNGCDDGHRGHGHGSYIQNGWPEERFGESKKIFRHNISAYNHCTGMKSYGESPGIRSTHFFGNIYFGNGMTAWTKGAANYLAGSLNGPMEDIVLQGNHFFQPDSTTGHLGGSVYLGYGSDKKISCTFTDNFVFGGGNTALNIRHWQQLIFRRNTIYDDKRLLTIVAAPERLKAWDFGDNVYYQPRSGPLALVNDRKLGIEQLSSEVGLEPDPKLIEQAPQGVDVHVMINEYDADRAHVALYNWQQQPSVKMDLSEFLQPGESYTVHSALDYRGQPLAEGVASDGTIELDMPDDVIVGRQFQALVVQRP